VCCVVCVVLCCVCCLNYLLPLQADESNVNFDRNSNTLTLSKIFQWYRPDFGSDLQLQELLVNGVTGKRGISLKNFFEEAPKPKLVFADYNWDLNEA